MSTLDSAISHFEKRPLGNIKVMMVEDDPVITDIVTKLLSREGCVPYATPSGREALELAKNFMPDAIILDLMMPDLSGEDLLIQLKINPILKRIPVVVFTNKTEEGTKERVLGLGASEYLTKASTELMTLVDVIRRMVVKGD
jgi:CheY-like chemotaxis protein